MILVTLGVTQKLVHENLRLEGLYVLVGIRLATVQTAMQNLATKVRTVF